MDGSREKNFEIGEFTPEIEGKLKTLASTAEGWSVEKCKTMLEFFLITYFEWQENNSLGENKGNNYFPKSDFFLRGARIIAQRGMKHCAAFFDEFMDDRRADCVEQRCIAERTKKNSDNEKAQKMFSRLTYLSQILEVPNIELLSHSNI